jgi:hypothetical protein
MLLEVFDQPVAFVHERSLVSPLTMNDRPGDVDVTAKPSRSVTLPRRRRSLQ